MKEAIDTQFFNEDEMTFADNLDINEALLEYISTLQEGLSSLFT